MLSSSSAEFERFQRFFVGRRRNIQKSEHRRSPDFPSLLSISTSNSLSSSSSFPPSPHIFPFPKRSNLVLVSVSDFRELELQFVS